MIIHPITRGFICTTAHPMGCQSNVLEQIHYVSHQPPIGNGPKKVLIIGASTGYGLASRIVASFGAKAQTIGVFFERAANNHRTASPGWYNTAAFERAAHAAGLYAKSINGDAFSNAIKQQTIELIQKDWAGHVDLIIYSLAAPCRTDPTTGQRWQSTLKPLGKPFKSKTINVTKGQIEQVTLEPATLQETEATIAVMGGQDWMMWIEQLKQAKLLAYGLKTVAYSYFGPKLTYPIYRHGTIGQAKNHLVETSKMLQEKLHDIAGQALISVNKALVTQASAAIPIIPLYLSLLYKVMKAKQLHEGCIEQIYRLYAHFLYNKTGSIPLDNQGFIRLDNWEMQHDVQTTVTQLWDQVSNENIYSLTDFQGYCDEFYKLFGFHIPHIDYNQESIVDLPIPSLV